MAAVIFNGAFVKALKSRIKAQNGQIAPGWLKFSFDYQDIQAAALNNTLDIHELVALEYCHAMVINVNTQFSGGSITSVNMTIGPQTDLDSWLPGLRIDSTSDRNIYAIDDILSISSDVFLRADFTAVGGNLNTLTQGQLDIHLLLSKLPDFTG